MHYGGAMVRRRPLLDLARGTASARVPRPTSNWSCVSMPATSRAKGVRKSAVIRSWCGSRICHSMACPGLAKLRGPKRTT